jgi:tRNA (guanine-N7-)-methyltransferase
MGQKKLLRFEAIGSFPNVLQYPQGMPGQWNDFFHNSCPITLELACGKGEYTCGLAAIHPERNFIGVDLKGNRIYIGASYCLKNKLTNAAFLRTHIDKIDGYFAPGEIDSIWITFPDPHLRVSRSKKRLTHPRFLRLYQKILIPGGLIHLKTDSPVLYHFTRHVIERYGLELREFSEDVYGQPGHRPDLEIKTHYEKLDLAGSRRIFYLCFSLPAAPLPPFDQELMEYLKETETGSLSQTIPES